MPTTILLLALLSLQKIDPRAALLAPEAPDQPAIKRIAAPGVPGPLLVWGDDAQVVAVGDTSGGNTAPVVATTKLGRGRIVVFGHGGYLTAAMAQDKDTGPLIRNAIQWAQRRNEDPVWVTDAKLGTALEALVVGSMSVRPLQGDWASQLDGTGTLVINPGRLSKDQVDTIRTHTRRGGGLLIAGLGWGWLQLNPNRPLNEHPVNLVLADAGVCVADGTLKTNSGNGYNTARPPSRYCHAATAVGALSENLARVSDGDHGQIAATVTSAIRGLPADDRALRPRLEAMQRRQSKAIIPSEDRPLRPADALERCLLTLEVEQLRTQPAQRIRPHPAASRFPGRVPRSARLARTRLTIDTDAPGWHSTGLYAAPGAGIAVDAPADIAGHKLRVRIGAHKDLLWHKDEWKRVPEVTTSTPLERQTQAANAFGGLVYIEVPDSCQAGQIELRIRGAIEAPYFVLDQTELRDWQQQIRARPAPWAELATSKVILTVPSRVVRRLNDPEALLRFWDRVLDSAADLAGIPAERRRPERFVTDVQISAGYMHAGYPIMTHLDVAEVMVNLESMQTNAHGGVWGLFHELGHNHQEPEWTFAGTGEVTCNLFTLYAFETVCGLTRDQVGRADRRALLKRYPGFVKGGRRFEQWKSDPFLALLMYAELEEEFGWDAYRRVFREYRALPASERPKNDAEKRDQWLVRMSKTVGRNLSPFFADWGVPVSDQAREAVAHLPEWTPKRPERK